MKPWDVAIIGGGILGTSIAYWLSTRYDARIAVIEQETDVATHASGRNTGVIHRPFYLHPEKSRLFAQSSLLSYDLWRRYAEERGLPWKEVGTLKLAMRENEVNQLETYMRWAEANGMEEGEVEFLDAQQVGNLEPHVKCVAALHAKKETAVDFGAFTRELRKDAEAGGVKFLLKRRVLDIISTTELMELNVEGSRQPHQAKYVVNCAGGAAMDMAHCLDVGKEYTDLHFRGDYWRIDPSHSALPSRNIYTVPRHPQFPFLDPHLIVRAAGDREIGPTAVPVATPWTYSGFYENITSFFHKLLEPPVDGKAHLLVSPAFVNLALEEALKSLSKSLLVSRVRVFLPNLQASMLIEMGTAGVRSSVIDRRGRFVKEILELEGPASAHILNYNSPGATGAPAYTAALIHRLESRGFFEHFRLKSQPVRQPWNFDKVVAAFN